MYQHSSTFECVLRLKSPPGAPEQLGLTYLAAQNFAAAASAFRRATELNPKDWRANLKLSELMSATRKKALLEEVASRPQEVLRTVPGNTEARDTLALTDLRQGSADAASIILEETLHRFPSHLQSWPPCLRACGSIKKIIKPPRKF